jgi:hypothetical protein
MHSHDNILDIASGSIRKRRPVASVVCLWSGASPSLLCKPSLFCNFIQGATSCITIEMLQQRQVALLASKCSRTACFKPVHQSRSRCTVRDSNSNGADTSSKEPMISEDVLARLRAAEEEAAKLRSQLAAVQGTQVMLWQGTQSHSACMVCCPSSLNADNGYTSMPPFPDRSQGGCHRVQAQEV